MRGLGEQGKDLGCRNARSRACRVGTASPESPSTTGSCDLCRSPQAGPRALVSFTPQGGLSAVRVPLPSLGNLRRGTPQPGPLLNKELLSTYCALDTALGFSREQTTSSRCAGRRLSRAALGRCRTLPGLGEGSWAR